MRIKIYPLILLFLLVVGLMFLIPALSQHNQVTAQQLNVFASPVQAGCYIAGPNECRIHVEPFTINIATGSRMANFSLVTIQSGTGTLTTIYDWRPDQSNPVPFSGTTFTPSLVTQDYGATCGKAYQLALLGKDSLDSSVFTLGSTAVFTCPASMP
jgi:hypothetical protein